MNFWAIEFVQCKKFIGKVGFAKFETTWDVSVQTSLSKNSGAKVSLMMRKENVTRG